MTVALSYFACTLVLTFLQVVLTTLAKRRQDGVQWAMGNRDTSPAEYTGVAGRMVRAQANLYEALPIFIGAVLLAHVSGRENGLTNWGAALFFWGRLTFIPIYAAGLTPWRTLAWCVSLVGLVLVMVSLA